MKRCPACGSTYPSGDFCPVDGTPMVAMQGAPAAPAASRSGWSAAPRAGAAPAVAYAPAPSHQPHQPHPSHQPMQGHQAIDAAETLAGTVLDNRYQLEGQIGVGGMGVVYRATHTTIGKPVAVKVLRQAQARMQDVAERFAREAQLASKIKHPNVVDIFDYGNTPVGSPYYVMEFLEGHSLAWEIDNRGRLDPRRALNVAIQTARGLAEAHRHGVIHRDLKPDNIYLVPVDHEAASSAVGDEQAKILDFGIARVRGARRLTAAGAVVGTPEYMSPEQAQGNDVDARTDLYALGIILFEMLAGQVPLRGETMAATLTKQVFDAPPKLRDVATNLPQLPQTERVLMRLMAKNRDERPSTAAETVKMLEVARDTEFSSARSAGGRATVAIGSWSVGDQAPAPTTSRASGPKVGGGPLLAPPKSAGSSSWGGAVPGNWSPAEDSQPSGVPGDPRMPVATNPAPRPSGREQGRAAASKAAATAAAESMQAAVVAPPAPAPPTPGLSATRASAVPRKAGMGPAPMIILGVGAAVFAALVTVTAVRMLDDRAAGAAAGDSAAFLGGAPAAQSEKQDAETRAAPKSAAEAATPPAAPSPEEGETAAPENADPEISAEPAPAKSQSAKSSSKATSKKSKGAAKPKSAPSAPSSPSKPPKSKASETETGAKNDPTARPEAPSVSLGDLKDPFSDF